MADADVDRWKAHMEQDFNPGYTATSMPKPDARVANAAEYSAYQLGQINRSLKQIAHLLGQKT